MNSSTTLSLDAYFSRLLDIEAFHSVDSSMNGIQVDNDGSAIKKIAFAVDASLETFIRCEKAGVGMIFVHHGLFWGKPLALRGGHRERLRFLLEHNIALYACHLPLDVNPRFGNNIAVAALLGIENPEPFGLYHGIKVGFKGSLAAALTVYEAAEKIAWNGKPPLGIYPFGKEKNESCAVITGGGAWEALEAMEQGIDLYVTGEMNHTVYHHILEGKLNMIADGHYSTEVWGVRRVMAETGKALDIETEFIDVPTGL